MALPVGWLHRFVSSTNATHAMGLLTLPRWHRHPLNTSAFACRTALATFVFAMARNEIRRMRPSVAITTHAQWPLGRRSGRSAAFAIGGRVAAYRPPRAGALRLLLANGNRLRYILYCTPRRRHVFRTSRTVRLPALPLLQDRGNWRRGICEIERKLDRASNGTPERNGSSFDSQNQPPWRKNRKLEIEVHS